MRAANRALVVIALWVVLVPGRAVAQGVQGGVHGGVTFSNVSNLTNAIDFGGPIDVEHRTGVVIGPFVAFPINETLALQVEALYATKGGTPTDGENKLEIRLAYLDFPLLLRIATPSTQRFFFLFGPSLNVNVSAKTIDLIPVREETDVKDQVHDAEFGLVVGGGTSLGKFLVEGRYSAGLTNFSDTPEVKVSIKNRSFTMLAGIRF